MQIPNIPAPDITEHGARGQKLDRRLFMQLLVFTGCHDTSPIIDKLESENIHGALYTHLQNPSSIGLLTMHEDPAFFATTLRTLLNENPFKALNPEPGLTMMGRTYSIGYEHDLEDTLLERPRRTATNPDWPWVIWYPLRRKGEFHRLPQEKQREILSEHGRIGMSFGQADYVHDIRLACHGLDANDNDFLIGLTGTNLHPLSAIVQTMRGTQQTSLYLERLGPFFVGYTLWKSSK